MTKGEKRKARKAARKAGKPLTGELAVGRGRLCVLCRCSAGSELHGFPVCGYHKTHGEDDPTCPNCGHPPEPYRAREEETPRGFDDRGDCPMEFTETPAGYRARERWAKRYEELNGAPDGDWDR